ncbi:uncharacterized protein PpBr36_06574 [Pyricularia pennisetigena]|uniref:uncharacterized protein n=1 Tax=Pyricularia pennisetigena TaxID=1578925 RepID=UPI00115287FA|nr:uncharacterized protein PpBr36_06574 [Pyricularia pennisetigena]TLS22981.1 hypothetical protein PpBr36_06574 [Pyricularia pennisetigena]
MGSKTGENRLSGENKVLYQTRQTHTSKPCSSEANFCSGDIDHPCDHQMSLGSEPVCGWVRQSQPIKKDWVIDATIRISIVPLAGRVARWDGDFGGQRA